MTLPGERVVMLWELLPLLVPLAALGAGRFAPRVAAMFPAVSALLTWVLGSAPRPPLHAAAAAAATLAFAAVALGTYVLASPGTRGGVWRMALAYGASVLAGLVVVHQSTRGWPLERQPFRLWLLVAMVLAVVPGAVVSRWIPERARGERCGRRGGR